MKQIYFMRHAETIAMVEGIMAGSEYETVLSDRGKQQAKEVGQFLKDKGVELIMVSPMKRTRQTAQIIADELGLDKSKQVLNDLVVERSFGSYSGRSFKDYRKALKEGRLDMSQLESTEDLFKRTVQAFKWLEARPEKVILVVSHGATCRMFRLVDQKLAHHDYRKVKGFGSAEIDEFTL